MCLAFLEADRCLRLPGHSAAGVGTDALRALALGTVLPLVLALVSEVRATLALALTGGCGWGVIGGAGACGLAAWVGGGAARMPAAPRMANKRTNWIGRRRQVQ